MTQMAIITLSATIPTKSALLAATTTTTTTAKSPANAKTLPATKTAKFKLHITTGSGKMAGLPSINTSTLKNDFCTNMRKASPDKDVICTKCYAARLETMRPSLVTALERNAMVYTRLLTEDELPRLNYAIFRFDSFGELHNMIHLINYFAIALKNPNTMFGLWTKRLDIVRKVLKTMPKPTNVILIHSSNQRNVITPLPKGYDKVFTAHTTKVSKANNVNINCHSSCNECRLCYENNGVTYINEISK
jgi:hypothetical protein